MWHTSGLSGLQSENTRGPGLKRTLSILPPALSQRGGRNNLRVAQALLHATVCPVPLGLFAMPLMLCKSGGKVSQR